MQEAETECLSAGGAVAAAGHFSICTHVHILLCMSPLQEAEAECWSAGRAVAAAGHSQFGWAAHSRAAGCAHQDRQGSRLLFFLPVVGGLSMGGRLTAERLDVRIKTGTFYWGLFLAII